MSTAFPHDALRGFTQNLLAASGVPAHAAALVADSLIAANLRGVDSHGILLVPSYISQIEAGHVNPSACGRVVSENGACMVYDGDNGLGQVTSEICCEHVVRLARNHGLGMVVVRDSSHFAAAAHWAQRISAAGMIAIVSCNAAPRVSPWQGREPRFGTNPICMSVPGAPQTWLLDMATTTVSMGKIYNAALAGSELPYGWAIDAEGSPTTDSKTAAAPMPLGGYKGYGLAMMMEILSALLSGGAMGTEVRSTPIPGTARDICHMFLAIDVARFLPVAEFGARIERYVEMMKATRPAPGYDEVLVAGDPEWRSEEIRRRQGIPISPDLWKKLEALALRLNVPLPEPLNPTGTPDAL